MKRQAAVLAVVSVVLCSCCMSCAARKPAEVPVPKPSPRFPVTFTEDWIVAYATDFSGDELGPEWVVTAGDAVVEEGVLALRAGQEHAEVILEEPYFESPCVRVEFDAYVADDVEPREMSVFLNANEAGCAGAYLFQFGAEGNTVDRLRRVGEIVEETVRDTPLLEHRHLYHVVAENDAGKIRLQIDGLTVFEWNDPNSLWGPEQCYVGFYTWESEIHIEGVKVFHRVPVGKR